jgi:hypothetical protein
MAEGSEFESRQEQDFSPLHVIQASFGTHAASYPLRTGPLSPGVKQSESEADNSPPTSAEVKNTWIYISTPPYAFMA